MKAPARSRRSLREDLVLESCLEVMGQVLTDQRMADRALESVLRAKKHLYSTERRAVAERVYALLRRLKLVEALLEDVVKGFHQAQTTRKNLARLAVSRVLEGEPLAEVGVQHGLTPAEIRALERLPQAQAAVAALPPPRRLELEGSLPALVARQLLARLGEAEAFQAAQAMNRRAPLNGRVNLLRTTRAALLEDLSAAGVQVSPTGLSPLGLTLVTRHNVYSLTPFVEGLFEVQDEGSQLLGMLVDAPPRRVVDACAGAGGKTLQLAAQMDNRGELYALDVDARRLQELKLRARRAGVHNVRIQALPQADDEADAAVAALGFQAERVLIDAPCSGTGTYRRKPDARYRFTEAWLAELVALQKRLLRRFAPLVKPKGRLVYGTCSVLREENEEVVEDFLAAHPHFSRLDASRWLPPEVAAQAVVDGALRLWPHRHGTDGFFGVVLGRE